MGKSDIISKLKKISIPTNLILLVIIIYSIYYVQSIKEGVISSNCCGGVQAGVHYRESDTSPPEYIRRCFKSRRDEGSVRYEWNGFPCSSEDGPDCCTNLDGSDLGECVPTTGGGYCDGNSQTIFRRGESTSSPYVRRSDDTLLDINNTIDMEDYFYDRSEGRIERDLSQDMLDFLQRKDQNNAFIQSHIVSHNREKIQQEATARLTAEENKKSSQIRVSILAIHLIFILSFSILIKELIIKDIDSFYDLLNLRYLEFTGKNVVKTIVEPVTN